MGHVALRGNPGARGTATLAGVVLSGLLLTGCATTSATPAASVSSSSVATASTSAPAATGTALTALNTLAIKGRAPKTGYTADQFGPAWADVDGNGCDTRNDILGPQLAGVTFKAGTHNCVVLTGTLADPYTGREIAFTRGVDHPITLAGPSGQVVQYTRLPMSAILKCRKWIAMGN